MAPIGMPPTSRSHASAAESPRRRAIASAASQSRSEPNPTISASVSCVSICCAAEHELDPLLRDQLAEVPDDRRVPSRQRAQPVGRLRLGHGLVVRRGDRVERCRVPGLEGPLDLRVGAGRPAAGGVGIDRPVGRPTSARASARGRGRKASTSTPGATTRPRSRISGRSPRTARAPRRRLRSRRGRRRALRGPARAGDPAGVPRTRGRCRGSWRRIVPPPGLVVRSPHPGSRGRSRRPRCRATRPPPAAPRRWPAGRPRARHPDRSTNRRTSSKPSSRSTTNTGSVGPIVGRSSTQRPTPSPLVEGRTVSSFGP